MKKTGLSIFVLGCVIFGLMGVIHGASKNEGPFNITFNNLTKTPFFVFLSINPGTGRQEWKEIKLGPLEEGKKVGPFKLWTVTELDLRVDNLDGENNLPYRFRLKEQVAKQENEENVERQNGEVEGIKEDKGLKKQEFNKAKLGIVKQQYHYLVDAEVWGYFVDSESETGTDIIFTIKKIEQAPNK